MRSEFTWGGDFPLPVEIDRGVERSVKNRYDLMMSVESEGVDIFVKAQMAWTIARSEFGFSIPMVNFDKMSKSLGNKSFRYFAEKYMDCLVKAGQIGWYRSGDGNAVWGFERNADRIKDIIGDYKSDDERFEEQLKSLESNAVDNVHDDPSSVNALDEDYADDPLFGADIELSSSASSESETSFDAVEPVPAEKPADPPIPHKKSFAELMRERRPKKDRPKKDGTKAP